MHLVPVGCQYQFSFHIAIATDGNLESINCEKISHVHIRSFVVGENVVFLLL